MLAPNEPSVDIEHIVMQARGEKHKELFQNFIRQVKEDKRSWSPVWRDGGSI